MLSLEAQDFIRNSPFLFIATSTGDGAVDVSPRGDAPQVLSLASADTLILPDRAGNNRLDTVSNMLDQPKVALAVLKPGEDRFLRIRARAAVSIAEADLKPFEIRGQLPLSAARFTVEAADFIATEAFRAAQFWSPASANLAPLDLFAIIKAQLAYHAERGVGPEAQMPPAHAILERSGIAPAYQTPSHYVERKSFAAFDPHTSEFIAACRFGVLAFQDADGELDFAMLGGAKNFAGAIDLRQFLARSRISPATRPRGRIGGLFVRPGMPESLRVNGRLLSVADESGERHTKVETTEMFLHCSNSFVRSRIWRPRLAWNGKREFICRARVDEARDIVSFLLAPLDDAPLQPFTVGQYVTVSGPETDGKAVERCYSLSSAPSADQFRITVKRHDRGQVSRWLHDEMAPGKVLLLGAPRGRFCLAAQSQRPVALISAGVGVTPMMAMLHHLMASEPDRPVWFIHGARNGRAHALHRELGACIARHPALRMHVAYSWPNPEDRLGRDYDQHGRIDVATLASLLDLSNTDFYLCGPNDFMLSLKSGLLAQGVPEQRIRLEVFGAPLISHMAPHRDASPATVSLTRSGMKLPWTSESGPLLDLLLSHGVTAPFICRQGDCQSCAQRVLAGTVAYPPDADIEPAEGFALLCQATPLGDVSLDL